WATVHGGFSLPTGVISRSTRCCTLIETRITQFRFEMSELWSFEVRNFHGRKWERETKEENRKKVLMKLR
ncbi:hypothetical protein RSW31_26180, partial [Escherichia coli]|uniref:hypothetical protein n=1 Tax=Escherichia coli TaxID=562 RepID=UPI0028DDB586